MRLIISKALTTIWRELAYLRRLGIGQKILYIPYPPTDIVTQSVFQTRSKPYYLSYPYYQLQQLIDP
jgi:hypothetical protein